MEFDKSKLRQIRWLMVFAALLVLAVIYSGSIAEGAGFVLGIAKPFLYGGVIAFVLNLPLTFVEKKLLKKWKGKIAEKVKRPIGIFLSMLILSAVIALVICMVVPQISRAAAELGRKVPPFLVRMERELEILGQTYPALQREVEMLQRMEIDWTKLQETVFDFLKNGAGDVLTSAVSVTSGIVGGIVNAFIAVVFALYILGQKEKLADQGKRIMSAYLPERVEAAVLKLLALSYCNFSSFLTGQCTEAVILGCMFVVAMSIFRMPYAFMVGVLIAFTALIPIVGAFIGCAVGAFLILINDPVQALWFIILFLVLQQIEGNLVYPRVVGSSVGLPSIWVLMAVTIGGSLFGVAGMLFFIPLTATGYTLLREHVNARNAAKTGKQIPAPVETDSAQPEEEAGSFGESD